MHCSKPFPQCLTLCNDLQSSAFFFFLFINLHLTCRYENLLVWQKLRLFCTTVNDQCKGCCIHYGVNSFLKYGQFHCNFKIPWNLYSIWKLKKYPVKTRQEKKRSLTHLCVAMNVFYKVALIQKRLEDFYFSKINIPNHYPEQKI